MQSSREASYQETLVSPVLEPVKTETATKKWETDEEKEMADSNESTSSQEPLSPAARLFHAPQFNCTILTAIGCKTSINPGVIKMGLEQTLMKHPRFSKKLVRFIYHVVSCATCSLFCGLIFFLVILVLLLKLLFPVFA